MKNYDLVDCLLLSKGYNVSVYPLCPSIATDRSGPGVGIPDKSPQHWEAEPSWADQEAAEVRACLCCLWMIQPATVSMLWCIEQEHLPLQEEL